MPEITESPTQDWQHDQICQDSLSLAQLFRFISKRSHCSWKCSIWAKKKILCWPYSCYSLRAQGFAEVKLLLLQAPGTPFWSSSKLRTWIQYIMINLRGTERCLDQERVCYASLRVWTQIPSPKSNSSAVAMRTVAAGGWGSRKIPVALFSATVAKWVSSRCSERLVHKIEDI